MHLFKTALSLSSCLAYILAAPALADFPDAAQDASLIANSNPNSDLTQNGNNILSALGGDSNDETGFESFDYADLEKALAKEMFNMDNLFKGVGGEANGKAKEAEDGDNKEARVGRSTSLEGRLLRSQSKGKSGRMPRWMKLAREMKRRNGK